MEKIRNLLKDKPNLQRKCDETLFCTCLYCNPTGSRHIKQIREMHKKMKEL